MVEGGTPEVDSMVEGSRPGEARLAGDVDDPDRGETVSSDERRADAAIASRAKASNGVTSFIVSTESTGPPEQSATAPNVVEPPRDEDDAEWRPPPKAGVVEEPIAPPDAQTCTMKGEVGDQGRISGRWGMTREALLDVSQTSPPASGPRPRGVDLSDRAQVEI